MSNLNLLPPEIKEQYEISKKNRTLLNIFIGIILLIVLISAALFLGGVYLKTKLNLVNTEVEAKEQSITKYGTLEKDAKELNERLGAIKKIMSQRIYFSKALDQLWSSTPSQLFVLELDLEKDASKRGKIIGTAETKKDVADLVKSLEQKEAFEYVNIEDSTISLDDFLQRRIENFTLSFSLKTKSLNE